MKPSFTLPLIALVAWFGTQSEASARFLSFPPTNWFTVPPANGSIALSVCDANQVCQATYSLVPPNPSSQTVPNGASSATGTITLQPSPSVLATENATAGSTAVVLAAYYFGLNVRPGLTLDAHIKINISGKLSATNTSNGTSANAFVDVQTVYGPPETPLSYNAWCTYPCRGYSFSVSKDLQVFANILYVLVMTVNLTVGTGHAKVSGSLSQTGPIITLDPRYASNFQLLLSPNVGIAAHQPRF